MRTRLWLEYPIAINRSSSCWSSSNRIAVSESNTVEASSKLISCFSIFNSVLPISQVILINYIVTHCIILSIETLAYIRDHERFGSRCRNLAFAGSRAALHPGRLLGQIFCILGNFWPKSGQTGAAKVMLRCWWLSPTFGNGRLVLIRSLATWIFQNFLWNWLSWRFD